MSAPGEVRTFGCWPAKSVCGRPPSGWSPGKMLGRCADRSHLSGGRPAGPRLGTTSLSLVAERYVYARAIFHHLAILQPHVEQLDLGDTHLAQVLPRLFDRG